MSEVTAEQLREQIAAMEALPPRDRAYLPQRMVLTTARLLADRPLTLAALQAGAEEWDSRHINGEIHLVPRSE